MYFENSLLRYNSDMHIEGMCNKKEEISSYIHI